MGGWSRYIIRADWMHQTIPAWIQARLEETPCRVFGQLLWKHDKCDPSRRKRRPWSIYEKVVSEKRDRSSAGHIRASYVLYRKRSLWISEKKRSGISGVRSCRNDCFAFLYSNDRSEYFSFKSAYYVFRSDGRWSDRKRLWPSHKSCCGSGTA